MKTPINFNDFQRILDKAEYVEVNGYIVKELIKEPGQAGLGYVHCDEFNNCTVKYCVPNNEYFIEYGKLYVKHSNDECIEVRPLVLMRL